MSFGGSLRRNLFWLKDAIAGKAIKSQFDEIDGTLNDYASGLVTQQSKIDHMLDYACKNAEFYNEYAGKKLSDFPIIDRSVIRENEELFRVKPESIPAQKGDVFVQRTSGSTGAPLAVGQDIEKRKRRVAEIKWFNEQVGFRSHEKLGHCRIWTKWHNKSKWQSFRENIYPIDISVINDETLGLACNLIHEKRIEFLRSYASWYTSLVEYLEKNPSDIPKLKSLKVCISSSEHLDESTRSKIASVVGCDVVECYANEENGILGQQRLGQMDYQLNHSGYFFEFLHLDSDEPVEPGEIGRIIVTDLHNHATPLIRYDTGDTGVYEQKNGGAEGDSWPVLKELYGRRQDMITAPDGSYIHPMVLARILKNILSISQWQFIQKDKDVYELKINAYDKFDETECRDELSAVLGDRAILNIKYVDEIPVLQSGKRRPVVSEYRA